MGWLFYHRDKGESNDAHFKRELFGDGYEILGSATVRSAYYAAVKRLSDGDVSAVVVLMQRVPKDYYNFGYKDMSEEMGPYESKCPVRILDLLPPTDNECANEWRERCRAFAAKPRPKASPGDTVKFAEEIEFVGGTKTDRLEFVKRSTFRLAGAGLFRIPNWRDRDYEIAS